MLISQLAQSILLYHKTLILIHINFIFSIYHYKNFIYAPQGCYTLRYSSPVSHLLILLQMQSYYIYIASL